MCKGLSCPLLDQNMSSKNNYKVEDANHLIICKPPTKDHPSYFLLLRCLQICLKVKINLSFMLSVIYLQRRKILNKTSS